MVASKGRSLRLGVLTSGGDCAGLNAAIRAVVRRAILGYGWTVLGIRQSTQGLMERPVAAVPLGIAEFDSLFLRTGGTVLETVTSGDPFAYPTGSGGFIDRSHEAIDGFRLLGLDALICTGGDGSLRILRRIAAQGSIPMVFIPKTIDNDVSGGGRCIGHETAVAIATDAVERLQSVASSQRRLMVLEVMGRDTGHIAVAAGIAGGADVILIPEIPVRLDVVIEKLRDLREKEKRHGAVIVIAEGVHFDDISEGKHGGVGDKLAAALFALTGQQVRATSLGHVQRGGTPIASDRLIASALGTHAVDLVARGEFDRIVAWRGETLVDVPFAELGWGYAGVDPDSALVRTARGLGISFGDVPGEGQALSEVALAEA